MFIYLSLIYITALWLREKEDFGSSLFFILLTIFLPISLKIARIIMLNYRNKIQKEFENLINSNSLSVEDNKSDYIDQIIRMIIYQDKIGLANDHSVYFNIVSSKIPVEQAERKREFLKMNLLRTFQIKMLYEVELDLKALKLKHSEAGQIGSKSRTRKLKQSGGGGSEYGSNFDESIVAQKQIDMYQQTKEEIISNQFQINEKQIEGKIYIDKNQIYGVDNVMADNLQTYFHRAIQNSKNKSEFTDVDILHLVYILEVLGNEKLFLLKLNQMKKKVSLKQYQILKTLEYSCQNRQRMHINQFSKDSIFHPEYQESLSYDNLLQSLQHWIDETIEKKIMVLNMMRQRHIVLTQLKNLLEDVSKRRQQIIQTISHLVQLNDKNSQLHALYICYLENLAFTDKDINLNKFKKQQQNNIEQRNYLSKLDRSDACVVFSSLTLSSKGLCIKRTTKNFEKIYNYKFSEIKDQPVEKLLPYPYHKQHQKLVKNFFNDSQQNEKGFVPLGFSITQKGYLLPVEVSIRVSQFAGEFGMAAYIQVMDQSGINFDPTSTIYNYSSKEYLVYDERNLKVISMTLVLHKLLFTRHKTMQQIFLRGSFPFLKKMYQNSSMRSDRTYRSGGKSSNTLLQSSRYMNSHRSISSSRKRAEINVKDKQQTDKKNKKDKKKSKQKIFDSGVNQSAQIQILLNNNERKGSFDKQDLVQFLMITQCDDKLSDDQNPQFIEKNFQFFTMIVRICEGKIGSDATINYLEITKIQEINAFNSCAFLLNAFDDQLDVLTNKSFFSQLIQNKIIDHLERFYLYQSLIQSGEIDCEKYNFQFNKQKLKWNNMSSRYSSNEFYQFYVFQGYKLLPEVINEIEGNEEIFGEYAKSNDTKAGSAALSKWLKRTSQGNNNKPEFVKEQGASVVSEEALAQYFDNDKAQRKQQSQAKNNYEEYENAKQIEIPHLEDAKRQQPSNQKAIGNVEKQIKSAQPFKNGQDQNQIIKVTEEFSLINSQVDLQESPAKGNKFNAFQNQQYTQPSGKAKELNDILDQSPFQQNNLNQASFNNVQPFSPGTINTQQDNQILGNYMRMSTSNKYGQKRASDFASPTNQFIPKTNMDTTSQSITPINAQHAVFGAAMFQQSQSIIQNLTGIDISQQQLLLQDQNRISQIDQSVLSPDAAAGIYMDGNGYPFYSQNNVYQNNGIPPTYVISPNGEKFETNMQLNQSQQSLMNQSQGQNDLYKSLSKTSKFFNSKFNQTSQLKSLRSKLNSQALANMNQQISTMNPASQDASKNMHSNTGEAGDDTKMKQKEYQNIQDAGESSSTHSKLSNLSSQKKQVNHIIFSTKDLSAMKVINVFGLLSIAIIISVTLYQYYSMNRTFADFQYDSEVADWPMRFISNMSLVSKAKNFLQLIDVDFFKFTDQEEEVQIKAKNAELQDAFQKELSRLSEMHRPLETQQLFYFLLDNEYKSSLTSLFGQDTDLSKVSSNDDGNFKYIDVDTTIFYGLTMIHQYLYRFAFGSGIPRGQFASLLNQDKLETQLEKVFTESQAEQTQGIKDIRTQLTSLMILILIICPLCISIIIPLYAFIQTRRQEILQLFGTFSIQRLEQCIQETRLTTFYYYEAQVGQAAMSQKQNILNKVFNHNEVVKKQTLSSSSPLPKFSIGLFICALIVFVFTLPYPIINQSISNRYMDESQVALRLKSMFFKNNFIFLS